MNFTSKYRNYIITFGVEFIVLILGFLVYRIASENMSELGFSEYTLSRRSIAFLQPLLMIGLGVAVPRYVSIYTRRNTILSSSMILLLAASIILSIAMLFNQEYFAILFFGDIKYIVYIFPLILLLIANCFHAILYGFLRGKRHIYSSNIIQLINKAILPLLVVIYTSNIYELLYINSIVLIVNCIIITLIIIRYNPISLKIKKFIVDSRVLLKYGLPRVLGDFSLLALLTAPTYLILYFQNNILISGDVAYSITLLNLIGAAFGPLGLVLLPEIAHFMQFKQHHLIQKRFYAFIVLSMILTVFGYVIYYLFSEQILNLLLGEEYRKSIEDLSITILLGSFGYTMYIVLRSFLDAIKVKATNAFNLIISLFIYIVLTYFNYTYDASVNEYLYSFVISINLLGVLTFIQTYRAIKKLNP